MASKQCGVREFLEKNNLSQYDDLFMDQGYDDMNQIISMAENSLELDSLMKDVTIFHKPGHRKRFVSAVQILASKAEHGEPAKSQEGPGMELPETTNQGKLNDISKWPPVAKELWIPNPLTPQLIFYNNVVEEIFNSSFELMAPLQFKDYVVSQRISRWKIEKEVADLKVKIEHQLDRDNKDGRAQNIARFSSEKLNSVKPGDVSKAESAKELIQHLLDQITTKIKDIIALRSSLFNKDNNIKPWRANELLFFDSKKSLLEELAHSLDKVLATIITNSNYLKRRIDGASDEAVEAKRKKNSARKNALKSAKEKDDRLQNKVDEVINLLTDGKLTQTMVQERADRSICINDMNKNCQLIARFHSQALSWLIGEKYFAADAMGFVTGLKEKMNLTLEKASEKNEMRKKKQASSKSQKTLFQCFSSTKTKDNP